MGPIVLFGSQRAPGGAPPVSFKGKVSIVRTDTCFELARRANLQRTYISDIERGARNTSLRSIKRLADALKVSLQTLFRF